MSICEVCKERETGRYGDGTRLVNYVCERCRTSKGKCPLCGNRVDVVSRK